MSWPWHRCGGVCVARSMRDGVAVGILTGERDALKFQNEVLRAENADLRRLAADQLARDGQEMDEPRHSPTHQSCCSTPDVRCTRWCAECDRTLESGCPADALRAQLARTRTAMVAFQASACAMRRARDRLSAGLREMARRVSEQRSEATYWASGDWQVENRTLRAELAELKAGRASGATRWECQHGQPPQTCRLCEGIRQRQPFASLSDRSGLYHPPSEACVHCASPARLASADPVVDCARAECPHVGDCVRCGHDRRHRFDDGACVELDDDR